MPIFSTSSLTDMPLVRLRELIMSRRCVRPISEIKRWFIRLKWLEWNESAGLYTPRSLIRKPKIYTRVVPKRNYKRGIDSLTSPVAQLLSLAVYVAASQATPFSMCAREWYDLRVKVLVVVLALRRELQVLVPGLGILEDFPFVIPDYYFFVVMIKNVTGIDRHFAAPTGSVDDELRHRIACGVAAQPLDDLNAFGH